jgi:hypothetical protein
VSLWRRRSPNEGTRAPAGAEGIPSVLLSHMGQFVRDQLAAFRGARRISGSAKHDEFARGVGQCTDGARRLGGFSARVNAYMAEILAEARLEESARFGIQRASVRLQQALHDSRCVHRRVTARSGALDDVRIVFTDGGFVRGLGCSDVCGDSFRFALGGIVNVTNRQLCVDPSAAEERLHGLVANGALKP